MHKLIKHRGKYNNIIKENTYEALLNALKDDRYLGIEFDIRSTKDNKFIVFHNPLYNNKLVSNTLYNEFPKYVPLLEDILRITSDKIFLIEIKNINNNYGNLIKILNKHDSKKIYIMSFSNKIINNMNISNRNYKVGLLNYILNTKDNIKCLDFIGILNNFINVELINNLKGKEIFGYGLFKNKTFYNNVYYIVDE